MVGVVIIVGIVFAIAYLVCNNNNTKEQNEPVYKKADYSTSSSSSSYSSSRIGDNYSSDEIKVVGGFYRSNEAKFFLRNELSVGDHVFMIPEPDNKYDSNAVMVISSNGLHIGYIPKYDAPDIKRKLLFEPIYGWVSESTDRCYEFLIDIESVTDMEEYDNAIEAYNNRKRREQDRADYIKKIAMLNFYEGLHDARIKYNQGLYDEAEQILKPFFENKIQENTCYALQICIYHIRKEYEAEEKLIDEFFEYENITENERMGLKRRKYHILRLMGVIVDDTQIESEKVGVDTTIRELDGFAIVENILRDVIDPNRIDFRDSKTLFAINLDDNRNKPICKFYFNNPDKMYIGLIEDKVVKYPISTLEDIVQYADKLRMLVAKYKSYDK